RAAIGGDGVGEDRVAGRGAVGVGEIEVAFNTEDPRAARALEIVAGLEPREEAVGVDVAAIRDAVVRVFDVRIAPIATALDADIEAVPIVRFVRRSDRRRRGRKPKAYGARCKQLAHVPSPPLPNCYFKHVTTPPRAGVGANLALRCICDTPGK